MTETDKSIAVLPFVNMSDDASNEYFSDGLSEELLNLLAKIPEHQSWAAFSIAQIYAFHGDSDTAFSWLNRAYDQRDGSMSLTKTDSLLVSLHDDPRWPEILEKMGLPR